MSDDFSFITIFFRLINFLLLIGVFYYIFKKYIKNQTEEKINQKEALLKGLEEQGYMLEGKEHLLDNRFLSQEDKSNRLKERLHEWQSALARDDAKKKEEFAKRIEVMNTKILYKNEQIKKDRLIKSVIPMAVAQARNALAKKFSNTAQGKLFIHAIIDTIKGES